MAGNERCKFFSENETIGHLFFDCSMARYVWIPVAIVVGAECRPCSFDQFCELVNRFMPTARKFHFMGLAAIYWSLWRARTDICFEERKFRFLPRSWAQRRLLSHFGQLQREGDKTTPEGARELFERRHFTSTHAKLRRKTRVWFCSSDRRRAKNLRHSLHG